MPHKLRRRKRPRLPCTILRRFLWRRNPRSLSPGRSSHTPSRCHHRRRRRPKRTCTRWCMPRPWVTVLTMLERHRQWTRFLWRRNPRSLSLGRRLNTVSRRHHRRSRRPKRNCIRWCIPRRQRRLLWRRNPRNLSLGCSCQTPRRRHHRRSRRRKRTCTRWCTPRPWARPLPAGRAKRNW